MKDQKDLRTIDGEQYIPDRSRSKRPPRPPSTPIAQPRTPKKVVRRPTPDRRLIKLRALKGTHQLERMTMAMVHLLEDRVEWQKGTASRLGISPLTSCGWK